MGALWTAITILGLILLIGIIVFAWKSNRDASSGAIAKADRGAAKLQDEIERDQDTALTAALPPYRAG